MKVVPPTGWKPDNAPWRDEKNVRVRFKIQVLSELSGENRQRTFRDIQKRLCYFLSGNPQSTSLPPSLPTITLLDHHFCLSISTSLPEKSVPSTLFSGTFWVFWPPLGVSCETRITSSVLLASDRIGVKYRRRLPFVTTSMIDPTTGLSFPSVIDEEDLVFTILNGYSSESAQNCINTQLCQVCSIACGFADSAGLIPASPEQLLQMQAADPSVICRGCNYVVHAKCIATSTLMEEGLIEIIARRNLDWFCLDCCTSPDQVGRESLDFGYQETDLMSRKEFLKKGKNMDHITDQYFWNLIESGSTRTVLYGTDIDSEKVCGGQFSTVFGSEKNDWNLRNLALSKDSVLKYLPGAGSITGVSRPWMYMGSPCSAFCWHAEDHYLTSVSYLHEGGSKIWYSVPGSFRSKLEEAFQIMFPDLVSQNPDLHHQLTTLVDPRTLFREFQIPYTRLVQNAGEFIITFPQAYHCGFNTGFNLAEAVNVAILDWLPHAVEAVDAYRKTKKRAVLCIDQLVWECCKSGDLCLNKDIGLFCLNYLKKVRKVLDGNDNVMRQEMKDVSVCTECNQFCYFACKSSKVCIHCGDSKQKIWLRHSLEEIDNVINMVESKLPRRSGRTLKKIKTEN